MKINFNPFVVFVRGAEIRQSDEVRRRREMRSVDLVRKMW